MWSRGITNLSRSAVVGRNLAASSSAAKIKQPSTITTPFSSSLLLRPLSSYAKSPLDAFRDPVDRNTRGSEPVGRSWSAKELRRKSYEDLHKLWYVLYKERNMLLTEQQLSRRRQLIFPQPERMKKVQKSMGAIKQVLGERKRVKIASHLASKLEGAMLQEAEAEATATATATEIASEEEEIVLDDDETKKP
jgi:large subunit ribosomal protein L47